MNVGMEFILQSMHGKSLLPVDCNTYPKRGTIDTWLLRPPVGYLAGVTMAPITVDTRRVVYILLLVSFAEQQSQQSCVQGGISGRSDN